MRRTVHLLVFTTALCLATGCSSPQKGDVDTTTPELDSVPNSDLVRDTTALDTETDLAGDLGQDLDALLDRLETGDVLADVAGDVPGVDTTQPLDPLAFANLVDPAKYSADLTSIALPRPPGSPHWQQIQDLCAARFQQMGYEIEVQEFDSGKNVIGVKLGSVYPDERVLVSAHYDGVADCDAADDNATGVAGTLEVARVLATGTWERTLVVACWDQEEAGLLGSMAYAQRASANSENIVATFVFEMIGYYSEVPNSQELPAGIDLLFPEPVKGIKANQMKGDFIAIISDPASHEAASAFQVFAASDLLSAVILEVPQNLLTSPMVGDLQRSDHASFWAHGYPAMMVTDTSEFRNNSYHCYQGTDSVDLLDPQFSTRVLRATVAAAAQVL